MVRCSNRGVVLPGSVLFLLRGYSSSQFERNSLRLRINLAVLCVFVISLLVVIFFFFFQAEDGIRDLIVTGVQTCALPISGRLATLPTSQRSPRAPGPWLP